MLNAGSSREPGAGEARGKQRFWKDPVAAPPGPEVQQGSGGAGGTRGLRTEGTDREEAEGRNQGNL